MVLYFTCLICIKELVTLTHLFLIILFSVQDNLKIIIKSSFGKAIDIFYKYKFYCSI